MSVKAFVFSLGCVLAWFVLLPVMVIGGGIALLAYAVFAELAHLVSGTAEKRPDPRAVRELAARICFGYTQRRVALSRSPL
jgi:hypothetical protein